MRRNLLITAGAAAIVLSLASPAWADEVTFSKGSLIIPMQSYFQTQGGMASAYGLVYRILLANQTGHLNEKRKVTVYIVNNPNKVAPNRCIPTNLSQFNAGVPSPNDPRWVSDGCDFSISNASQQPVVPVDYTKDFAQLTNGYYADGAVPTFDDTQAWPRYKTGANLTTAGNFNAVHYLGGPFVIDWSDAEAVIDLIRNGDRDPATNAATADGFPPKAAIDIFSDGQKAYNDTNRCTAAALSSGVKTVASVEISGGCHYVYMHQATASFKANVSRRINEAPKPFVLADPEIRQVLEKYIRIAGLWVLNSTNHADSEGCPVGNVSACTRNGSSGAVTNTPADPIKRGDKVFHGVIYDFFTDADLKYNDGSTTNVYPNGILNQKNAKLQRQYNLFWAPHWEANGGQATSLASVVTFVHSGGNIMTECASITSYENGEWGTGGPPSGSNFLLTAVGKSQSATSTPATAATGGTIVPQQTFSGKNCTDPGALATAACVEFGVPGNVFSQVGDWTYTTTSGTNKGFHENLANGGKYATFTNVMVRTKDKNVASTAINDAFVMGEDSDKKYGTVVYVVGHDVSGLPVGSRIVLNSTLNLSGDPVSSDRALAAPVVVYGNNDAPTYPDLLLAPTYESVSGYNANPNVMTFDITGAGKWVFPYFPGDLRAHVLDSGGLNIGESRLDAAQSWSAKNVLNPGISPAPGERNLFTYFGGYPADKPTLAGGAAAPNDVLQMGWMPESVSGKVLTATVPATGCVDVMGIPERTTSAVYDSCENTNPNCVDTSLHLVVGSDGLCDLQESLNYSNANTNANWKNLSAANLKQYLLDVPNVAVMLQRVRGFCWAGDPAILTPTYTQCTENDDNVAGLGGFPHSTPAVVDPSVNVLDKGAHRPTVAYAAGYDGQLHAFYVGGGSGYKGPAAAVNFPYGNAAADANRDASKAFATDYSAKFAAGTTPPFGTELWSYLPASQLPRLRSNSAKVDSSPLVFDAFADFGGSGLREWHSVLVQSLGKESNELFAMDVTNPLKPRLLWDIAGAPSGSATFSPIPLLSDGLANKVSAFDSCTPTVNGTKSALPGACDVAKWNEDTTSYFPYPEPDSGRTMTKAYDFQDLGGSAGLAIARVRDGLAPRFLVYAATNMPAGRQGVEVFAIDAATGQKVWQWEHEYRKYLPTPPDVDNVVPPSVSVLYLEAGVVRVLVGDFEGRIWELDGLTGVNVNLSTASNGGSCACSAASPCKYPLFDAFQAAGASESQPIGTNLSVARVPDTIPSGMSLSGFGNELVLIFGTGGANSLGSPSTISGRLHVLPYKPAYRVPIYGWSGGKNLAAAAAFDATSSCAAAQGSGVLQEPAGFPDTFPAGERIYGAIVVSGQSVFFGTATGVVPSDIMKVSGTLGGHSYMINLGTAVASSTHEQLVSKYANFGGVTLYAPSGGSTISVLGCEVSAINRVDLSGAKKTAAQSSADKSSRPESGFTMLRSWILRWFE